MLFVSVEIVEALQARMINVYGGSPGLRDRGLLESAVARAENTAYYNPDATLAQVGASLAWGLIKNHAFIDGNKRAGFVALQAFLQLNGYRLVCSEEEETEAVREVASGARSQEEWDAWVEQNIAPLHQAQIPPLR